jgi:hypothetical protein
MKRKTPSVISRAVVEMLETRRLFTLAAPLSYSSTNPPFVATGDLNGDGRSDVVTLNFVNNTIGVRLSNANGTLQGVQNAATGVSPNAVATGDFNNDGKLDVITGNASGDVSVLVGNGNGTFQPALTAALPPQFPPFYTGATPLKQIPVAVAVGDLNADGKLDVVVGTQTSFTVAYTGYWGGTYYHTYTQGYVDVLLGNGNGSFGTPTTYAQGSLAPTVALADFNGDNKLDLMTTDSQVAVRLGNGNGTLQAIVYSNSYGQAVTGDFNSDGKIDIVTGVAGALSFVKGKGTGAFENPVMLSQDDVRSIVAGDVNADGKLDLLVSTKQTTFEYYGYYGGYNPTTVDYTKVLLGYGDGTFAHPHTTTLGSRAGYGITNSSATGDFNGDNRPDLLATDPLNDTFYVQLNQNDWVLPGTLSVGDATVTEGHSGTVNAVFTVTLAAAPASNVTVNYGTADGDATVAGGDYVATSGTLTFTPGQTSKTITVPVRGDRVGEVDELFYVNLSNAVNADIVDGQGMGKIVDDEPRVSINANASATEGNTGTTPMTFTVTLSAASAANATVNFAATSGTAISGQDFDAASGTLTFAPGQTSKTISVAVRGDVIDEYDETLGVYLSGASNALIVNGAATGTITDNDAPPAMVISNVSRAEGNSGTTPFTFTLSLLSPSEKYINVAWATANGSATSSTSGGKQDYQVGGYYAQSFFPSQQSTTVTVYVIGDTRSESDETFVVNLSNAVDATIADAQGVGTILNDEGGRGKTWVGPATGGSWATAGNWSPSGVPVATSLVTIAGASVTLSSAASVSELTLNTGARLSVATNGGRVLRTAGLFFDGSSTLNLNDNDLIVDYTAGSSPLGLWNGGIYAHYYEGINGWSRTAVTAARGTAPAS